MTKIEIWFLNEKWKKYVYKQRGAIKCDIAWKGRIMKKLLCVKVLEKKKLAVIYKTTQLCFRSEYVHNVNL